MVKSTQGKGPFIAQGPRRGKAKRRAQLIQKLDRRRRPKFRGQDAFPRVALFMVPSNHAYRKYAYWKLNRRPSHATETIIMIGHDEKTVHCQASLTTIKQRCGYPDKKIAEDHANVKSQTKHERYATSALQLQQIFFQLRKKHLTPIGRVYREEFQVLPHL